MMIRSRVFSCFGTVLTVCLFLGSAPDLDAAFFYIGPFAFSSSLKQETIYTTNVEGVRPSQTDKEQEDIYIVYGFSLGGSASFGPETTVSLSTAQDWERHLRRSDLDTESDPFGLGDIRFDLTTGRAALRLRTHASYTRSTETRDSAYVGGTRTRWDENTILLYGFDLLYSFNRLSMSSGYSASQERHERDEFKDGDEDKEQLYFNATYELFARVRAVYEFDRERSDRLLDPDDYTGYEDTYALGLDVDVWDRPRVVYGFRYEREDRRGEIGEWRPIHTLTVTEGVDVPITATPTLQLSLFASYSYDRKREDRVDDEDIGFQYGLRLAHRINPLTTQTLVGRREPVDTFGSTATTTRTEWIYTLSRAALFHPSVSLTASLGYTLDEPKDSPIDEETLDFRLTLASRRSITRNLSRSLSYEYTAEDSSLESEILEEHRVTLAFNLSF